LLLLFDYSLVIETFWQPVGLYLIWIAGKYR